MSAVDGRRFAVPKWVAGLGGLAGLLLAWQAASLLVPGDAVPTPLATFRTLIEDGWGFYWPHLEGTGWEALRGFVWGNLIAFGLALLVILVPQTERVITQIGVASYCLPIIAVGPILTIVLEGDSPMVAMAALQVLFTTLIGVLAGLRAADPASLDLVRAYGGGRWKQLVKVRLIAALPSSFAALKIAAPSAVLGAIIGEFLGRVDTGLGLAMVVAQTQLATERTWGVAIVAGALAGFGYAVVALVARFAMPWERAS
ncbi:ABC transporter permease subunit [Actinocorallia sp. API 0066]|uniref:ABC transporter permease n=1 Tax=Actinocorallia sp. API 0066 TaxID=2896846 RepID=UPI001E5BF112|nr:ABC transporter permease subunit [Actinocorallia sp. API 0066]MCD0451519.1 ABC transporter permease subunit [Actinocorallia sp. API 0066]